MQNHFELFQLPQRFAIDTRALEQAYHRVQSQAHPDKFAHASDAEKRVAMQWATRANEAYQTLKSPLRRARYLCELNGVDLQTESNTAMAPAFLMQQMEWREMLDDARRDAAAAAALKTELDAAQDGMRRQVCELLDGRRDYAAAAVRVREWLFIDKLAQELAALRPI